MQERQKPELANNRNRVRGTPARSCFHDAQSKSAESLRTEQTETHQKLFVNKKHANIDEQILSVQQEEPWKSPPQWGGGAEAQK